MDLIIAYSGAGVNLFSGNYTGPSEALQFPHTKRILITACLRRTEKKTLRDPNEAAAAEGSVFKMGKRLYKIEEGKVLCGVCGGIAEYFGVDPTLIRLAWALFCLAGGSGILAYIVAALIMPDKSQVL